MPRILMRSLRMERQRSPRLRFHRRLSHQGRSSISTTSTMPPTGVGVQPVWLVADRTPSTAKDPRTAVESRSLLPTTLMFETSRTRTS